MPRSLMRYAISAALLVLSPSLSQAQVLLNSGANSAKASSGLGGAHAGYNWQNGMFLYGVEGDISAMHLHSAMSGGLNFPSPTDSAVTTGAINWYGTLRGRLGVTFGQALLYGTGGLAVGQTKLDSVFNTAGGVTTALHLSDTRVGWVVGAGFDLAAPGSYA